MQKIFVAMGALAFGSAFAFLDNPWEKVKKPSKGSVDIVGGYNAGCLAGASSIPWDGKGYQVIRTRQNRFYGTPQIVQFVKTFGAKVSSKGIVALIGDVSMARGGPFSTGHASHQIGLDADIWFLQDPRALQRPLTEAERNSLTAVPLADIEANQLIARNWKSAYANMLFEAAHYPSVERIFIHPAIKKKMCSLYPSNNAWLSKLRPWWGHNYHFHVRLECPQGASHCIPQDSVDESNPACDASLDWWFSEEWRAEYEARKKRPPSEPKLPVLPKLCEDVLTRQ